jgi:hypothetical protein
MPYTHILYVDTLHSCYLEQSENGVKVLLEYYMKFHCCAKSVAEFLHFTVTL